MRTFLPAMCPAFFMRVSPASRNAKPACMNMTSTAVMTTQIVDAATRRSCFDIEFLQWCAGAVVGDAADGCRPAEAVAGLVAAPRGVDDRGDDLVDDLVADDEHEQRLRQEARLEHAPPVLVRDAPFASVTDRFDHCHADVPRGVLDRVDNGLDALPDDDGLDLEHLRPRSLREARRRSRWGRSGSSAGCGPRSCMGRRASSDAGPRDSRGTRC